MLTNIDAHVDTLCALFLFQISRSLIEALRQFFVMFPKLRTRDLYIAGESFGGKMAVALAHAIHRLPEPTDKDAGFNLKGVMVINGLVDVESQVNFGI